MTQIQCPICKNEFEIQLNISVKTKGLTVFRGRMGFLGKLAGVTALMRFVRETFRHSPHLKREELIDQLMKEAEIPERDACHFVEKLCEEGFMYAPKQDELVFIG